MFNWSWSLTCKYNSWLVPFFCALSDSVSDEVIGTHFIDLSRISNDGANGMLLNIISVHLASLCVFAYVVGQNVIQLKMVSMLIDSQFANPGYEQYSLPNKRN